MLPCLDITDTYITYWGYFKNRNSGRNCVLCIYDICSSKQCGCNVSQSNWRHFLAAFIGTVIALILQSPLLIQMVLENRYFLDVAAALSVGIGIFLMVVTNTEHPPAASTSLGLVIQCCELNMGVDWSPLIFIMVSAGLLSGVRIALRDKMVNLL